MWDTEILQDTKGLAGLPLYGIIVVISFLVGAINLTVQLILGIAIATLLTIGIRAAYFRRRPDGERYKGIVQRIEASSFPSLHSMRAAVLATILSIYFGNPQFTVLFALATLAVGGARVMQKRHYTSDVIVGLIIGVLIGIASASV